MSPSPIRPILAALLATVLAACSEPSRPPANAVPDPTIPDPAAPDPATLAPAAPATSPDAQIEAIRKRIQAQRQRLRREAQQAPAPANNE